MRQLENSIILELPICLAHHIIRVLLKSVWAKPLTFQMAVLISCKYSPNVNFCNRANRENEINHHIFWPMGLWCPMNCIKYSGWSRTEYFILGQCPLWHLMSKHGQSLFCPSHIFCFTNALRCFPTLINALGFNILTCTLLKTGITFARNGIRCCSIFQTWICILKCLIFLWKWVSQCIPVLMYSYRMSVEKCQANVSAFSNAR